MRLIDADALLKTFESLCAEECCCCKEAAENTTLVGNTICRTFDRCGLIDAAPTIPAIPVEWLRNLCAIAKMETDDEYIRKAEDAIMTWAAEHPVVYPTWGEWFVEHGDLVDGWQNATNAAWTANRALDVFTKPIPADIAQKLGIEPKEGV